MPDIPHSRQTRGATKLNEAAEYQPSYEDLGRLVFADRVQELGFELLKGQDSIKGRQMYESLVAPNIALLFDEAGGWGAIRCDLLAVAKCPESSFMEFLMLVRDQNGNIGIPTSSGPLFIPQPQDEGQFAGLLARSGPTLCIDPDKRQIHVDTAVEFAPFFSAPFFRSQSIALVEGAHTNLIGNALSQALQERYPQFAGLKKAWLSLESNPRRSLLLVQDKHGREFMVGLTMPPERAGIGLEISFLLEAEVSENSPSLHPSQSLIHDIGKSLEIEGYQPVNLEDIKPFVPALTSLLKNLIKKQHDLVWQKDWRIEIDWAGENNGRNLAHCLVSIRDRDLNCIVPVAPEATVTAATYSGFMVRFSAPASRLGGLTADERVPFTLRYLAYLCRKYFAYDSKEIQVNPWALILSKEVIAGQLAEFMACERRNLFYTHAARAIAKEVLGDDSKTREIEILAVKAGPAGFDEGVRFQSFLVTTKEGRSLLSLMYGASLGIFHPAECFHFIDFFRHDAKSL